MQDASSSSGRTAAQTVSESAGRLVTVDALRAIALLGILIINIRSISGLDFLNAETLATVQGGGDRLAATTLAVLVKGKSLSAFSFLFGFSFTLFLASCIRNQRPFLALYLRRLFFLFCFGLINAAFFYWGDILINYAVLGLLLLIAFRLPQWLVLTLSLILLLALPIAMAISDMPVADPGMLYEGLRSLAAYSDPSFWTTVEHNLKRFFGPSDELSVVRLWRYTDIVGLFLLGLWTGRAGLLHDVTRHHRTLLAIALVAVPAGLVLELGRALATAESTPQAAFMAGTPVLAVGYIATAALLLNLACAGSVRNFFAPAGKMALTVYLMSGLIGEIIFYGWGLDLIGEVGTMEVLGIAILVYAGLLAFCHLWLGRFRYGPWEWVWRCLTYLQWLPITKRAPGQAAPR